MNKIFWILVGLGVFFFPVVFISANSGFGANERTVISIGAGTGGVGASSTLVSASGTVYITGIQSSPNIDPNSAVYCGSDLLIQWVNSANGSAIFRPMMYFCNDVVYAVMGGSQPYSSIALTYSYSLPSSGGGGSTDVSGIVDILHSIQEVIIWALAFVFFYLLFFAVFVFYRRHV